MNNSKKSFIGPLIKYLSLLIFTSLSIYYLFPEKKLDPQCKIDKIIVIKHKRELIAYSEELPVKTYKIALGKEPSGQKHFLNDKKTPEGQYIIESKNAASLFHLNLGISYPNPSDKKYANAKGKDPGGAIKIHGLKNGWSFIGKFHRFFDWTQGCIALTNDEIEELFQHVDIGTPIEIRP